MSRKRILLIDDYAPFANSLRLALSYEHDVVIAASGAQALEVLAGSSFDVVLCDLMMPNISGAELHQRISERWPGLERRMIFMTGGTFTPEAHRFLAEVDNPRLEKPFPMEKLNALVAATSSEGT